MVDVDNDHIEEDNVDVDNDDNEDDDVEALNDGETSKRFCTGKGAAFDSLFRKELRSQTLPILCLCILRQKFECGF